MFSSRARSLSSRPEEEFPRLLRTEQGYRSQVDPPAPMMTPFGYPSSGLAANLSVIIYDLSHRKLEHPATEHDERRTCVIA